MTTIAIAHDYLTQRGGAERVVLSMLKAFPDATIYTTLYDPDGTYPEFREARIVTSPLNRIGPLRRRHRAALPLLPWAARSLRITEDVVLASSSGWAHGFNASGTRIVYCYSPARWLYQTDVYLGGPPRRSPQGLLLVALRPLLRRWDRRQAARATRYLAISRVVQRRIRDVYGIESDVLPAPHTFTPDGDTAEVPELLDWSTGYHLVVSRLLPYKNVDAAVGAFAQLPDERLVVVGRGPERDRLRALAGSNVRLLESLSDAQMRWVYAHATTLIAPSIEDYGLTPLEAGAYGVATLALHGGGYLDTIVPGVNGRFFEHPTADEIRAAVNANTGAAWDASTIQAHTARFAEAPFIARLRDAVAGVRPGPRPDPWTGRSG